MDVQRIDKYLGYHFSDEVGDKTCICEPIELSPLIAHWNFESFQEHFNLQYLEQRICLQEFLIYRYADYLGIVNHGMAYELTEPCDLVNEQIHEVCGDTFRSPINNEEIDTAMMCYELQPEVYYDIAMTILASHVEEAICELEENGEVVVGGYKFYLVDNDEEEE